MSTIHPYAGRQIAQAGEDHDLAVLDAPVSSG